MFFCGKLIYRHARTFQLVSQPAYSVQRAHFHQKIKVINLQYFYIFLVYFWWLLKIFGGVFCGKLTLANVNNKNHKMLTKQPPVAITVPSGTQLHHWRVGIPRVYLRIFDLGPSNPTTFLGLCSLGDYRKSIESPMSVPTFNSTEKALTSTIYDWIPRIRPKKVCYVTKVNPLDVELI